MRRTARAISHALTPQSESFQKLSGQNEHLPWVCEIDDKPVSWIGFSDEGTRLAVLSAKHMTLFDPDDGLYFWRTPLSTYGSFLGVDLALAYPLPSLRSSPNIAWVRGAQSMLLCVDQCWRLEAYGLSKLPPSLQLCNIDAHTGSASLAAIVTLDDFCDRVLHVPLPEYVWQILQTFTSPGAHFIACSVQLKVTQMEQAVYMFNAATATLVLSSPIWYSSQVGDQVQSEHFLWSPTGLLATSIFIYDTSSQSIRHLQCTLPVVDAAFDRHGKYFGGSSPGGGAGAAVFDTGNGAVLLQVNDLSFCCFCSTQEHVIFKTGNNIYSHLQIWNLHQQQCLHTFGIPNPALTLTAELCAWSACWRIACLPYHLLDGSRSWMQPLVCLMEEL